MTKNKKIAIIGHFGSNKLFLDGQTIKTNELYNELSLFADWDIKKVDTYYKSHNPLKLLIDLFVALFTTKDIIILVAANGMKFFFPLLYFFARFFNKRIYQYVIGGSLDRRVKKYTNFKKYLNSFKVNWVEAVGMIDRLKDLGINNCELLYNFKRLTPISDDSISCYTSSPYRLCFFSRVMKEKGLEDAIEAIKTVNEKYGKTIYTLDIYGQIDPAQTEWFDNLKREFPQCIKYKGLVDYDKSVDVLKDYFALIFPTLYYTEGVPGTIIDAYASALPIIASKWENYDNIIDDTTGISYTFGDVDDLIRVLMTISECPEIINEKKQNCLNKVLCFRPEAVIKKITDKIESF